MSKNIMNSEKFWPQVRPDSNSFPPPKSEKSTIRIPISLGLLLLTGLLTYFANENLPNIMFDTMVLCEDSEGDAGVFCNGLIWVIAVVIVIIQIVLTTGICVISVFASKVAYSKFGFLVHWAIFVFALIACLITAFGLINAASQYS